MSISLPSLALRPILEKSGWYRLVRREQILVATLISVVTGLLFFALILSPLLSGRERIQKSLLRKQRDLQVIMRLQQEYRSLRHQSGDIQQRLSRRPQNFSLFSFIDQQATTSGVKQQINYLKPSTITSDGPLQESRVDMKLQQISLAGLVNFLKAVESPENVVFISRISIQEHGQGQGFLNAVIQIITYTPRESE